MMGPLSRRQLALDVSIAATLTVVGQVQLLLPGDDSYVGGPMPMNVVIMLLTTLPLAVRRIWPVGVACVVLGVHLLPSLFIAHTMTFWSTVLAMAVAMYTTARWARGPRIWVPPALFVLLLTTYGIHVPTFRQWDDVVFPLMLMVAVWGAGRVIYTLTGQRRQLDAALQQLAEQQLAQQRQVVLEERTRIAREMHDVVAHGVTVMVVQAGAARMELDETESAARSSLLAVESTGREVVDELRRTVSLLRTPDAGTPAAGPSPGLADIPDLVASMREAGLTVHLEMETLPATDAGRELVVYRVVQEALTNALRHAGATHVDVRVTADPGLSVEVSDSGAGDARHDGALRGGGNGLVGMRERVAMYGGTLRADQDGRGFVVRAEIPSEPAR